MKFFISFCLALFMSFCSFAQTAQNETLRGDGFTVEKNSVVSTTHRTPITIDVYTAKGIKHRSLVMTKGQSYDLPAQYEILVIRNTNSRKAIKLVVPALKNRPSHSGAFSKRNTNYVQ